MNKGTRNLNTLGACAIEGREKPPMLKGSGRHGSAQGWDGLREASYLQPLTQVVGKAAEGVVC